MCSLQSENPAEPLHRLTLLPPNYDAPRYARTAFFRFLVSVAYLNTLPGATEQNYSMLIHTSGRRVDHKADWYVFDQTVTSLIDRTSSSFERNTREIWETAAARYGAELADSLTAYVLDNISRYAIFVLNSDRDFIQNGLSATNPSALFTIIIGGAWLARGDVRKPVINVLHSRRQAQDTARHVYPTRTNVRVAWPIPISVRAHNS